MPTRTSPHWLRSENRRILLSMLVSGMAGIAGSFVSYGVFDLRSAQVLVWISVLCGWTAFAVCHSLITWAAFRGLAGTDLTAVLAERQASRVQRQQPRNRFARWALGSEDASSWAPQLAIMAIIGVGALVLNTGLRTPVLMLFGVSLVAASWLNVWVMYAVQYAGVDHRAPALTFPGRDDRSFSDYLYVALSVQTAFSSTDIGVGTTAMRRLVMSHMLVSFVYNTVIVAMLISLLITGF